MKEADDIPELNDADRQKVVMYIEDDLCVVNPDVQYQLLAALEARRRAHCPNKHMHDILLCCPECGLEA